jgi:hypothetical protein
MSIHLAQYEKAVDEHMVEFRSLQECAKSLD